MAERGKYLESKSDVCALTRKLKVIYNFSDSEWIDESLVKHRSTAEIRTDNPWMKSICNKLENLEPEAKPIKDNITPGERAALEELQNKKDIIIKRADKTSIMVIMERSYYKQKLILGDHLETATYERVSNDIDHDVIQKQNNLLEEHQACFTKNEKAYISNHVWKTSNFYINPKISKCREISDRIQRCEDVYLKMSPPDSLKGRPIIAGPASPIKPLSKLMDKLLSPLVATHDSYIKDDWDFIKFLPRKVPYDCELLTYDIVSLYTSIPHDLGLEAIDYWVDHQQALIPQRFTKKFILDTIVFILNNNNFNFDGEMWHQTNGTGMGIDFAGPYSCLTIGYLERTKLFHTYIPRMYSAEDAALIKEMFKRYVDDGFILWPTHLDVEKFIAALNQLNKSIRWTVIRGLIEEGKQTNTFLDIKVIKHPDNSLETIIFYKTTNNHHYLEYDSFHPQHVKDNIPFSMAKKINVFTTDPEKVRLLLQQMKTWFLEIGYPLKIIDQAIHNAFLQGPLPRPEEKKDVSPLLTKYSNYSQYNTVSKPTERSRDARMTQRKGVSKRKRLLKPSDNQ